MEATSKSRCDGFSKCSDLLYEPSVVLSVGNHAIFQGSVSISYVIGQSGIDNTHHINRRGLSQGFEFFFSGILSADIEIQEQYLSKDLKAKRP